MLKIGKSKNTIQTRITRKSEHLIVDEILNDHKILIGRDNTISSPDTSIADIKAFVLRSFPTPLEAGKNIKIDKNVISCVMYDDVPLKSQFEGLIDMYKGAFRTLNKDVYTTLPSKITQEIKEIQKHLYCLLDASISNNYETKRRFEAYCAQQIVDDKLHEEEFIKSEHLKHGKLVERFKSVEDEHIGVKIDKWQSEYERKHDKMKQQISTMGNVMNESIKNQMVMFEAKIEAELDTMVATMQEQEQIKLNFVQELAVKVSNVDKDIQKIKMIDPNSVKLVRLIDKITIRMDEIEKKIPFPKFTIAWKKRKLKYMHIVKMDEYLHIKETETAKVKKITAAAVLKEFNLNHTEC